MRTVIFQNSFKTINKSKSNENKVELKIGQDQI